MQRLCFLTSIFLTIAIGSFATCVSGQVELPFPHVTSGGCIAVIGSANDNSRYIIGYDIESGFVIRQRPTYPDVYMRSADGRQLMFRTGESYARPSDREYELFRLADRFPVLVAHALMRVHPDRITFESSPEGGWLVRVKTIRGRLADTIRLHERAKDREVAEPVVLYKYDAGGALTHISEPDSDILVAVQTVDAEHANLAPFESEHGWRIVEIDTWVGARRDEISESRLIERTRLIAMHNESASQAALHQSLADEQVLESMRQSSVDLGERSALSSRPIVWIASGVVLVAVGIFAWWKRR